MGGWHHWRCEQTDREPELIKANRGTFDGEENDNASTFNTEMKLNDTPELATRYLDVPNMEWETTEFPGIKIKVLYSDDTGMTTALFKLQPGAVVPLHEHTAIEQTYILEGTLEDHEGVCGPGQFCWRPAGNVHEAVAPDGAVILGMFLKPNRFAQGTKFFTETGE